jgi:hypothetical protein
MHAPSLQYGVDPPQTMPHAPQLSLSNARSTHELPHNARPDGQALHSPWLQYGNDSSQTSPHSPQLAGSQARNIQAPSQ